MTFNFNLFYISRSENMNIIDNNTAYFMSFYKVIILGAINLITFRKIESLNNAYLDAKSIFEDYKNSRDRM